MKISAQIDQDIKGLERYFNDLFDRLKTYLEEEKEFPIEVLDRDADEYQGKHHRISHYVKPDMLINIYSLVDFWLNMICNHYHQHRKLNLGIKDIKGGSDLNAFHKYLTKYVGLDLSSVETSYKRLDELRKVRNIFIHSGGHIDESKAKEFTSIKGIQVQAGTLIVIDEQFVWSCIENAKTYLLAATPKSIGT